MRGERYLGIILTVIALELAWIGVKEASPGVSAQSAVTRVVVAGSDAPITVTADVPLPVRPVPYTPSERPGE